ncbi:hypothetical protein I5M27_14780 [Adhaeribacter sp. BT258]|uniref:Secreted protein n=1 Tax=Adhaeribacter terrigena TaxID=2793070 RepID=A0ABS1C4E1_9BACT|nr:hypothetical protein [Adhaeribacter terrigena]MBK0404259.1 hypothetical protein [Adhaeribacter terrigena]
MFRQFLAYFLLLLFCRVLAPEEAVLALHSHEHTTCAHDENVTHFDVKHTHCQVDNFFDAPFQPATQHFKFVRPLEFAVHAFVYQSVWKFTFPNNVCLRGPPALS